MLFETKNFTGFVISNSCYARDCITACDSFSQVFSSSNAYALKGEIDCGALAFCSAISHVSKEIYLDNPKFYLDNKEVEIKEIQKISCDIHQKVGFVTRKKSFDKYISKLIKKNKFKLSAEELFSIFDVPSTYQTRKIEHLGNYQAVFLAIKGLIEGKRIFTTFWQGKKSTAEFVINRISDALIKLDCIFIVPASLQATLGDKFISIEM